MTKKERDTIRKVRELAAKSRICHLATTDGKKPQVRPMAFVLKRNGEIWLSTWAKSRKVHQLKKNPQAEVYFTAENGMHSKVDGVCSISTDPADKRQQWKAQPELVKFFDGASDPAFVIIKLRPEKYEFMAYGDFAYEVAEVS
jgi:general stress protein 26